MSVGIRPHTAPAVRADQGGTQGREEADPGAAPEPAEAVQAARHEKDAAGSEGQAQEGKEAIAADVPEERLGEWTVTRVVVKRNNPTLLDVYGHWWVEIDEVESYGWWPAVRPVPVAKAVRGVPGALKGFGVPHGSSPTVDPRHGELADHAFHPVTRGDHSDDQIVSAIRHFAAAFDGGWRWSIRPTINCRSFQADLLTAADLVVPDGYAHTGGAGARFWCHPGVGAPSWPVACPPPGVATCGI